MKSENCSDVLKNFYDISKIPRCSGNEKGISDYLFNRFKSQKLDVYQDDNHNLIVKKHGSKGYEESRVTALQAHLDMVCESDESIDFDFENDQIPLKNTDGWINTGNTTSLGADNGIGVAMMMSLLEDESAIHPPLEMIFTTEEETTFAGINSLNEELLTASRIINLDHSSEDSIVCGSAGGVLVDVYCYLDSKDIVSGKKNYELNISGITGGHSGQDIDKGRANAIVVLRKILYNIPSDIIPLSLHAGNNYNAIPRDASFYFAADENTVMHIQSGIDKVVSELGEKYPEDLKVELKYSDAEFNSGFSVDTLLKVLNYLILTPIGINTMEAKLPGVVSSSSNLGKIRHVDNYLVFSSEIRGAYNFEIEELVNAICHVVDTLGFNINTSGYYPPWTYNAESELLKTAIQAYEEEVGVPPGITALHAGLEAGVLSQKLNTTEIISIGPNIKYLHSPLECVEIDSIEKIYRVLKRLLAGLK